MADMVFPLLGCRSDHTGQNESICEYQINPVDMRLIYERNWGEQVSLQLVSTLSSMLTDNRGVKGIPGLWALGGQANSVYISGGVHEGDALSVHSVCHLTDFNCPGDLVKLTRPRIRVAPQQAPPSVSSLVTVRCLLAAKEKEKGLL
jgi:hypothetical protein